MDKASLINVLSTFGEAEAIAEVIHASLPLREPLPNKRHTEREKVTVHGITVYVEVGFYEDGRPGEVFLKAAKYGTNIRDMFDGLAIVLSVALQHGIPLSAFPVRGKGNHLTGEGNDLLESIFKTVEVLCTPTTTSDQSPSSTGSTTLPSAAP